MSTKENDVASSVVIDCLTGEITTVQVSKPIPSTWSAYPPKTTLTLDEQVGQALRSLDPATATVADCLKALIPLFPVSPFSP